MKYNKYIAYTAIAIVLLMIMGILCTNSQTRSISEEGRFKMYGSMRCGYTVKMLDYLKSRGQNVKFVDVNTPEGGAAFNKLNIRGVPYTIDLKTGEKISGFREINL